jgi:hypothetical protein
MRLMIWILIRWARYVDGLYIASPLLHVEKNEETRFLGYMHKSLDISFSFQTNQRTSNELQELA